MASKGMTIPGNMNMQIGPDTGLILLWNIVEACSHQCTPFPPPCTRGCPHSDRWQSLVK